MSKKVKKLDDSTRFASFIHTYHDEVEILSLEDWDKSINNTLFLGDEIKESNSTGYFPLSDLEEHEKYRVLITSHKVPNLALERLKQMCHIKIVEPNDTMEAIIRKARSIDAIFLAGKNIQLNKHFLNSIDTNKLKVVASMSHSYDNMDVIELSIRGIKIGVCRTVPADSIAELGLGLALVIGHRIPRNNYNFNKRSESMEHMVFGRQLCNSIVGIVTMGPIGMALICKLSTFNVKKIVYSGREIPEVNTWSKHIQFEELIEISDFIFITSELSLSNKNTFNQTVFEKMKHSAILINVGHGGIVNTNDLVEALQSNRIWGAGLDVTNPDPLPQNHPLLLLENCVVSPRLGYITETTLREMAMYTAENVISALERRPMPSQVRFKLTLEQLHQATTYAKTLKANTAMRYAAKLSLNSENNSAVQMKP